jgi:hypothetical protein
MDSQQEQLNHLQAAMANSSVVPRPSEVTQGQGAIPKRSCAQEALSGPIHDVTLPALRADGVAMSQAVRMLDALDTGIQGNSVINFPKALKRGWARPGGENAPRIPIPWPQDFIIGQGRKPRLLFDELDIHQFVQGAIAIIECEDDLVTVRAMLAQLRATMRDVLDRFSAHC